MTKPADGSARERVDRDSIEFATWFALYGDPSEPEGESHDAYGARVDAAIIAFGVERFAALGPAEVAAWYLERGL